MPALGLVALCSGFRVRLDAMLFANGDGLVSRDEAQRNPEVVAKFDAIDTNRDGKLSRDEMQAVMSIRKGEAKSP